MAEVQSSKAQTAKSQSGKANTVEKPKLPQVAFPLKPRDNNKNTLQDYFNRLSYDPSARFLFNESGLWHQGIHLRADKFSSSEYDNENIRAIADGRLVAYKVDGEYKTADDGKTPNKSAVYSTGFFLLEHEMEYPKGNKLKFYSLYRHTAPLSEYEGGVLNIIAETKSADNKINIKDRSGKIVTTLANGVMVFVKKSGNSQSNQPSQSKFDELVWYRDNQNTEHRPPQGQKWFIFHRSYRNMQEDTEKGLPILAGHNINTQTDSEVVLSKPIEIKAGEVLGLMGEYNQNSEQRQRLLHLEVFTYDDIEAFRAKAKQAYDSDKDKKGIQPNFLYVAHGSTYYSLTKDKNHMIELGKTQTEIMVPLSEVKKVTVTPQNQPKQAKDYYNIQPYLHSMTRPSDTGIYVDDSHLTHGILFPGTNVFSQVSNSLCIFKSKLHHYLNPKSELTVEQKNELDPLFKAIMDELDLDEDKGRPIQFEAGKLKDLLLDALQQRRLTGIIAKHDNEWKKTRSADFKQVSELYRQCNQPDAANRLDKRVADLSINLEVGEFNTEKQAYYLHPLALIGALTPYSTCFCHRDFTVEEFEIIVQQLRGSKDIPELWIPALKTGASPNDKSYESTVRELNRVMKKYDIDTCIRKIHFLAQAYHETHGFKSMQEYGGALKYDPYRGRGLIHLTHSDNYQNFSDDMNDNKIMMNPSIVATDMTYSFESGGWFWKKGKTISKTDKPWKYSGGASKSISSFLDSEKATCERTLVTYGKSPKTIAVIDLNLLADNDWGATISWLVNGGVNGFDERVKYRRMLKEIMKYENCINHK